MQGPEHLQQLVVRDGVGVVLYPERLGVPIAGTHAPVCGRLVPPTGIANLGAHYTRKLSEDSLRLPKSPETEDGNLHTKRQSIRLAQCVYQRFNRFINRHVIYKKIYIPEFVSALVLETLPRLDKSST